MARRDEVSRHDGGDGVIQVVVELDVSGCDDTDELRAEGAVLCQFCQRIASP
jgi:hypothetical protein